MSEHHNLKIALEMPLEFASSEALPWSSKLRGEATLVKTASSSSNRILRVTSPRGRGSFSAEL